MLIMLIDFVKQMNCETRICLKRCLSDVLSFQHFSLISTFVCILRGMLLSDMAMDCAARGSEVESRTTSWGFGKYKMEVA